MVARGRQPRFRDIKTATTQLLGTTPARQSHCSTKMSITVVVPFVLLVVGLVAADQQAVSKASNELGTSIYRKLADIDSKGGNVFISPVSVAAILGMVQLGAKGTTKQELDNALAGSSAAKLGRDGGDKLAAGFGQLLKDLRAEKGYELRLANAVFLATGVPIFERYKRDLLRHFDSGVYSADFQRNAREAAADVNAWVRDMTEDRIPEIVERPLPPSAPLLVLNAVYFRGLWLEPFKKNLTKKEDFYNGGSNRVSVDTMHLKAELVYAFSNALDAHILELPYRGDKVAMVIVLPDKPDGFEELEKKFSLETVREALAGAVQRRVNVALPKFQMQLSYNLKGALQSLGVHEAFSARDANLTGISSKRPLALDEVLHKALLDVDEEGTEAIALSSGIIRHSRVPDGEVEFKADHPFMFFIEDVSSQTLLFLGRLMQL